MHRVHTKYRKPLKRLTGAQKAALAAATRSRRGYGEKEPARNDREPPPPRDSSSEPGPSQQGATRTRGNAASGSGQSSTPAGSSTSSKKKLEMFEELIPLASLQNTSERVQSDFIIIQVSKLEKIITSAVQCKNCQKNSDIRLQLRERKGFAEKLVVKCETCGVVVVDEWTSDRLPDQASTRPPFKINRAMTSAFLSVGLGHAGMLSFCSTLGMNSLSDYPFNSHLKSLKDDLAAFKEFVLSEARRFTRELYELEDPALLLKKIIDTCVSYDGTWQKRGFSSLYGIGFVIDIVSGLVVDYEILSKHCYSCLLAEKSLGADSEEHLKWLEEHSASGTCNRNYSGSSPYMETEAAVRMWQRSVKEAGMRYITVLSDGDAKTFGNLSKLQPYGEEHPISKEECINHVSKRMYRALKTVVAECRAKKITLGGSGEGQLTDKVILKLSNYYRLAIESNLGSVTEMRAAVLATLYHYNSTDRKHNHSYCPKGTESWCFFNKARAKREKPASHSTMSAKLNSTVFKHIKPVYERLSDEELLSRCLRGGTQNNNECLHSVVWHKTPKEVFISKSRLEIGVVHAIAEFNMGKLAAKHVEYQLRQEPIPKATVKIARQQDRKRVKASETGASRFTRKQKRKEKADLEAKRARKEGTSYQAGGF